MQVQIASKILDDPRLELDFELPSPTPRTRDEMTTNPRSTLPELTDSDIARIAEGDVDVNNFNPPPRRLTRANTVPLSTPSLPYQSSDTDTHHHDVPDDYDLNRSGDFFVNAELSNRVEPSDEEYLDRIDVAALVINRMMGTGIFITPNLVLKYCGGDKGLALGMWILGGIYTLMCFGVYAEYGVSLPFNGGELRYLDELWPSKRRPGWPPLELLTATMFSFFFILLGTSAANSLSFAKHILLAANSYDTDEAAAANQKFVDSKEDYFKNLKDFDTYAWLSESMVKFVAITILTIICLIIYLSRKLSLRLNTIFAAYKLLLLFAVMLSGFVALKRHGSADDWKPKAENAYALGSGGYYPWVALVLVIFSFQGWENANYVAGQIKPGQGALPIGGFTGIGLVTVLYVLVNVAYLALVPTPQFLASGFGIAIPFSHMAFEPFGGKNSHAQKGFGNPGEQGQRVFMVLISLSAIGNLLANIYALAHVKQAIGKMKVVPFHNWIAKEHSHFRTPVGGIVAHWIFTVILVAGAPWSSTGFGFISTMFTCGHAIIAFLVAVGLPTLEKQLTVRFEKQPELQGRKVIKSNWLMWPLVVIFACTNLYVVVAGAILVPKGEDANRRYQLLVAGLTFVFGAIWWCILQELKLKNIPRKGTDIPLEAATGDSVPFPTRERRWLSRRVGVELAIIHNPSPPQSDKFGLTRNLEFMVDNPSIAESIRRAFQKLEQRWRGQAEGEQRSVATESGVLNSRP